jgi:uncharacterized protein
MTTYNNETAWSGSSSAVMTDARPLLRLVYLWMTVGLVITGAVAAFIASDMERVFSLVTGPAWMLLIFVQLGMVLGLSWGISRMSPTFATGMFLLYSAVTGLTVGVAAFAAMVRVDPKSLNLVYDVAPVAKAFFTTGGLFGAMTIIGFTTKVDLSRYSTFFMMALIGLVIAMVVNIFLRSDAFSFAISAFGVLLFTALTAWDTQKIKNLAAQPEFSDFSDSTRKLAVLGALTLYLDFINLFLFLLRLFSGNRR